MRAREAARTGRGATVGVVTAQPEDRDDERTVPEAAEREPTDRPDSTHPDAGTSSDAEGADAGTHENEPSDAGAGPRTDAPSDVAAERGIDTGPDAEADQEADGPLDDDEVDRRFASILDQLGVGGASGTTSAYTASALGQAPVERPVRPPAGAVGPGADPGRSGPPATPDAHQQRTPEPPVHVPRALGPRDQVLEEHPEDPSWGVDGFVPPDPPGPDLSDPAAILGWLAAVGPLVLGVVLGILGHRLTVGWMLLGLAVMIAGVVVLVRRLPDERGPDHGSDGAVV